MLELREVTKRYASGNETITAVDRVSLTIDGGELVALFGPSGSGKTTVLLLAAGIVEPDGGAVLFDGMNLGGMTRREMVTYRRDAIGVFMQSPCLHAGLTALDNAGVKLIAAGMTPRRARARTLPLLELVGLGERAYHRPAELSTGERQRVGLVQALSNSPKLVLADEPTGNLDSRRGADVLGIMARACREQGVAGLLVTHDAQAARYASRVLTLGDGSISETAGAPIALAQGA